MNKHAEALRKKGRFGDTILAHIAPSEALLLKLAGGSGTINPKTGLPEFFMGIGGWLGDQIDSVPGMGKLSDIGSSVWNESKNTISDIVLPVGGAVVGGIYGGPGGAAAGAAAGRGLGGFLKGEDPRNTLSNSILAGSLGYGYGVSPLAWGGQLGASSATTLSGSAAIPASTASAIEVPSIAATISPAAATGAVAAPAASSLVPIGEGLGEAAAYSGMPGLTTPAAPVAELAAPAALPYEAGPYFPSADTAASGGAGAGITYSPEVLNAMNIPQYEAAPATFMENAKYTAGNALGGAKDMIGSNKLLTALTLSGLGSSYLTGQQNADMAEANRNAMMGAINKESWTPESRAMNSNAIESTINQAIEAQRKRTGGAAADTGRGGGFFGNEMERARQAGNEFRATEMAKTYAPNPSLIPYLAQATGASPSASSGIVQGIGQTSGNILPYLLAMQMMGKS